MIDLRSDTVTQPTPAMLQAMHEAEVGDDVFGEDPSINALEEATAAYFGHQAGLFCPSGTMANQVAIQVHTQPGQEVICHHTAHIYNYEGGGVAFNSGCQVRPVGGERGLMAFTEVQAALQARDIHKATSALLVAEHTANKGGGSCYSLAQLRQMSQWCQEKGLAFHLDGARVWNALVATGQDPRELGACFDSLSVCFSKGLGCPVGSVLVGSSALIAQARYIRKKMGGGMRQAGYLAAAGLYALQQHIERLAEDHRQAQRLAKVLETQSWVSRVAPVETNIVIFESASESQADSIMQKLRDKEILIVKMGPTTLRMVTHLNLNASMIDRVIAAVKQVHL